MEDAQSSENQSQSVPQTVGETPNSGVSFPTIGEPKKSGGAKTLLVVGILVLVGILGFVIYKSAAKKSATPISEPTPYDNLNTTTEETATPVASPTATAKPADKTKLKVQIQNGTGITGEAAYLQTLLKGLGYTDVTVGNSANQDLTATQVSYASTLTSDVTSELTTKLNSVYQTVTNSKSTSTTYDIVIITGLRKGATAKPSASPTATSTASPSASPSH
jgi:hypothetical protein